MKTTDLLRAFTVAAEDMAMDWLGAFRTPGVREGLRMSEADAHAIEDAFGQWAERMETFRQEHGL